MSVRKLRGPARLQIKFDQSPEAYAKQLKDILRDRYSGRLIDGALTVLRTSDIKIRFHLFALAIRELQTHVFHQLAPDEQVKNCPWYVPVPKTHGPTRAQRAKYAVQGGLSDEALGVLRYQVDDIRDKMLEWFEKLNKFTHLRPRTTVTNAKKAEKLAAEILSVFTSLFYSIYLSRSLIYLHMERAHPGAIEAYVSKTLQGFEGLATQEDINDPYFEEIKIRKVNSTHVYFRVEGSLSDEMRFRIDMKSPVNDLAAFKRMSHRLGPGEFPR